MADYTRRSGNHFIVYVAGPFSHETAKGRAANIRRAEDLGLEASRVGDGRTVMPFVPHVAWGGYFGKITEQEAIHWGLEIIEHCDGILLVPGWQKSKGTLGEIKEAERLGLPVFRSVEELEHCISNIKD